ncbi:uncharacterized protein LOC126326883 [Schistocerca gregaria]|uniref:uncharacterized protein LOC126326883 n=1 Tax=Schistocerca gregaria TaxID=7010 RepID=UPI00211DCC3A|nr:uncharacterized protein LOC126326883 [Schistocerca gregaria]
MDSLKNKSSAGWDEYSPFLLKKCKRELAIPLVHLINCVVEGGVLPMKFKLGIVKPLYQKDERKQPQNYRPVALTSVFGKLIEKIKLEILNDHHNTNNLIGDFEHGLRSGRSTKSATVRIVHCLIK